MLSVIIPSRSPQFLRQTVESLLGNAEGEVEVIVVFDGIWPPDSEMPPEDDRVVMVHHGEVHNHKGMRASINQGMRLAKGEYVMVIDEQCSVDKGYDVKLAADCEDNWVVVPRRQRLAPDSWKLTTEVEGDRRPPVDYMILDYPYQRPYDKTCGLHGAEDRQTAKDRSDVLIDDLMTMQGSCYFMKRSYWEELFPNGLDDVNYGTFTQEAQEVSNTAWLSGGAVKVNKKTWYAHWHKGKGGKGYGFSREQYKRHCEGMERGRLYCIDYWVHRNADNKYPRDFAWLIEKFNPPGWPKNWQEQIKIDRERDFSATYKEKGYDPKW